MFWIILNFVLLIGFVLGFEMVLFSDDCVRLNILYVLLLVWIIIVSVEWFLIVVFGEFWINLILNFLLFFDKLLLNVYIVMFCLFIVFGNISVILGLILFVMLKLFWLVEFIIM